MRKQLPQLERLHTSAGFLTEHAAQNNASLILPFCFHVWPHDCSVNINIYGRDERAQIYKGTKSNYLALGRVSDGAFGAHTDEVIGGC